MYNPILERFCPELPTGWTTERIGDCLVQAVRPIHMKDSETYRLVSIRRRNGGMFDRQQLKGREILTKDLQEVLPNSFAVARRQIVHGASTFVGQEFAGAAVSSSYSIFMGTERCSARYFSRLAQHPLMYAYFTAASHGIVIEKMNFDQDRWLTFPVHIPPPVEQERIVETLDSLDESIRSTRDLIAKLESAQRGLFDNLLQFGLGDEGQPRSLERNREEIAIRAGVPRPRAWRHLSLLELVDLPSGQVSPLIPPYRDWPLVAPDHIESGTGRLVGVTSARHQGAISGKYAFRENDVLYSKIRPYLRKVTLAPYDGLCSADMYPLRPCPDVNPAFLTEFLLGAEFSAFAEQVSMRTGIPKMNREELAEFSTWWPDREEQDRIARVFEACRHAVRGERTRLEKLEHLKLGLMDGLLTGRIRVNAGEDVPA